MDANKYGIFSRRGADREKRAFWECQESDGKD
jgi:hypothetical protein